MNAPLVSVVIPVCDCERYLAEAIESALAQAHRPNGDPGLDKLEVVYSDRAGDLARAQDYTVLRMAA